MLDGLAATMRRGAWEATLRNIIRLYEGLGQENEEINEKWHHIIYDAYSLSHVVVTNEHPCAGHREVCHISDTAFMEVAAAFLGSASASRSVLGCGWPIGLLPSALIPVYR
jgi:hypothetical protein